MRTTSGRIGFAVASLLAGTVLSGCITLNKPMAGPPTCCPGPVAPVPAPKPKRKIVLRDVNFDFDKSAIRPDARAILDEDVSILQKHPGVHVLCIGYTDSKGTIPYNQRLSMRRAVAVRNYLVSKGIPATATTVEGRGESQPVATNATDDGRAENRRVELRALRGSLEDEE
jgi:OOP family OmpA-OmpF porin